MSDLNWIGNMSNPAEIKEVLDKHTLILKRVAKIVKYLAIKDIDEDDINHIYILEETQRADDCTWGISNAYTCKIMMIDYGFWSYDDRIDMTEYFPIDWLFLDDDRLKTAIDIERQRRNKAKKDFKKNLNKKAKRIAEEKEYAEYKRLKAKFEGKV